MIHLQIERLSHHYGSQAVFTGLTVDSSTPLFGVSGSNGSGKSTLLRCLAGLLKPKEGTILWSIDGENLLPTENGGRIGFAAPYVELYEPMSVRENLHFLQRLRRSEQTEAPAPLGGLLERFQAETLADKPYGELSTGQRQRVKLAAAFLHDPPVICLDEPGSNLDGAGRELVRKILQQNSGNGRMIVIASNRADELELCGRTLNLDD